MTRRARTLLTGLALTGAVAAVSIGGATTASAQQYGSFALKPGSGVCVSQYASYQVRGEGWATNQGAKFKLMRNGVVIVSTSGRVPAFGMELRSSFGTFPGPGLYSVCAQNTGTANTIATLQLRTDSEF